MKNNQALCLAVFSLLHGLAGPPAHAAAPMVPAGETFQIADRIHVIPDMGVALVPNVGIVVGDESILVIDTGMGPANAETVLDEARKISSLPIRYLVSTHFHPEHNFGAQSFPAETLIIYATAQRLDLERKGEHYRTWFVELFGDDVRDLLKPVELVEPDLTFERRAELNLGGMRAELHYFGSAAHTGGDTVVYLPRQKIAFVGDLVPNGYFPILADADSSIRGWLATLDAFSELRAETIVPGHGPVGKAQQVSQVRDYLTSIQKRSTELQSEGVALKLAQERLFSEFTERYPDWGEPNWIRNAVEIAYAEATPQP